MEHPFQCPDTDLSFPSELKTILEKKNFFLKKNIFPRDFKQDVITAGSITLENLY